MSFSSLNVVVTPGPKKSQERASEEYASAIKTSRAGESLDSGQC